MTTSASLEADVVVIGGGLSGLMAADFLVRQGVAHVLLVEARDRLGGRLHTHETEHGALVELGGAYIGPREMQPRVWRLIDSLGVQTYKVPMQGRSLLHLDGRTSSYEGVIPSLALLPLLDLNAQLRTIRQLCQQVPLDAPWDSPLAPRFDSLTVAAYLDQVAWTAESKKMITAFVQGVLCAEPSEVSMLYFLWYCHVNGGPFRLADVENGGQESKATYGIRSLYNGLADRIGSTRILLSQPVDIVDWSQDGFVSLVTRSGLVIRARRAICALAPPLVARMRFVPALPSPRMQLMQRYPMGSIIKTTTYYATPFWRARGLNGVLLSDVGPVTFTLDDTKPGNAHPAIMGFILANQARAWLQRSEDQRREAVLAQYAALFGTNEALNPTAYYEKRWNEEEFSLGCYTGVVGPGVLTGFGRALREPCGPIEFAGTETALAGAGYMDGAIEAGERAARAVLAHLVASGHPSARADLTGPADPVPPRQADWVPPMKLADRWLPSVPVLLSVLGALLGLLCNWLWRRYASSGL